MGFASSGAANEDRVTLGVEEAAGGEFAHQSFIDRRVREDELVDILQDRELGAGDAVADRAGLPVGAFGAMNGYPRRALRSKIFIQLSQLVQLPSHLQRQWGCFA